MSRASRVLLELTAENGQRVFVSPPHIRTILAADDGASIEFCDGVVHVRERAEIVASLMDRFLSAAYLGNRSDR